MPVKNKQKFNKRQILHKLVDFPTKNIRVFLQREFLLLNRLLEKYEPEFLMALTIDKKKDSLKVFFSDYWVKELKRRHKIFNYKPKTAEPVSLFEKNCGEDIVVVEQSTLKDFIDNG